ncbi:MAG TPA: hypothetical protein VHZ03_34045 [Trebonia sp.]|nr:hypothetical protein [Trebonia sp.]
MIKGELAVRYPAASPSSRSVVAPASGAAKTSRFFGHCPGRVVRTTAASHRLAVTGRRPR